MNNIQVSNADEAKAMLESVMNNQEGAARDIVLINAGAAIYVSGIAATLAEGVTRATAEIVSGAAKQKLEQLVQLSNAN